MLFDTIKPMEPEDRQLIDWKADCLTLVWFLSFVPWLFVGPLSGMVFDAWRLPSAYMLVGSLWSYPVSVGIAAKFRERADWLVLLPFLNVAGVIAASALESLAI